MKRLITGGLAALAIWALLGCREEEPAARRAAAEPYRQQAVGLAGWSIVGAGFTVVAAAALAKQRPRRKRLLVRAAVQGQQPAKMVHSPVYVPPPHRRGYRSNRRRV